MDLLQIKDEQDQSSELECTLPLKDTSDDNLCERIAVLKSKIMNGQLKLKEKHGVGNVWNIFSSVLDENGDEIEHFVACRKCFHVYQYFASTLNLVKHECYIQYESGQNVEVDNETKIKLNDEASQWLVTNCRPLTILNDSGLKKMAQMFLKIGATFGENVNINDIMPNQTSVKLNISELYEAEHKKLTTELKEIKCYSVTYCVWKDILIQRSFLSVTIHYVKQSTIINQLLAVTPLNSDFYSDNKIQKYVKECLQNFECDLNKHDPIIVSKNTFANLNNHNHIHSIVNLLNDFIEGFFIKFPHFQELQDKDNKSNKHNANTDELYDFKSSISLTRRNPIFYLHKVSQSYDRSDSLTIIEIKNIATILQSFQETLLALESENKPTMHLVMPHLHRLKKLCALTDKDIHVTTCFKKQLKEKLDLFASLPFTKYHRIALFLFPPTNKLLLFKELERNTIIKECKLLMQQFYVQADNSRKRIKIDLANCENGIFTDFIKKSSGGNKNDAINDEINEYLAINITLSEEFQVLEWWKANEATFPLLYKVSCKVLSAPASIITSERAMFQARNLLGANPTAMPWDDDMINKIIFLNNNYKY